MSNAPRSATARPYRMARRIESVERTRRTVIDAARALLVEGGPHEFTLQRIAGRAGVTRPTVYQHFGSRRGLLEALVADAEQRAGIPQTIRASDHPEPVEAMADWLRGAVSFWASEHDVLAAAFVLSHFDPELAGVLSVHDEARRRRAAHLARRLATAGVLRHDCPLKRAGAVLWALSGLPLYQQFSEGGLATAEVAETVVHVATFSLISQP